MIFIFQALRLSHVSFIKTTTGQIVNLVTNDIQRLESVMKTSDLTNLLKRDRRDIREGVYPQTNHMIMRSQIKIQKELFIKVLWNQNEINEVDQSGQRETNYPFNSQIRFVILLTTNRTILMILVQRIYYWIDELSKIDIFLYSHHLLMVHIVLIL